MAVDKVTYTLGTGSLSTEQKTTSVTDTKNLRKTEQTQTAATDTATAGQTLDSAEFSTQAKDLQETEKILRFALEKLESFDEVRQDRLSDVKERLDQDFYFDESVDQTVSERIFSNQEIAQAARQHLEVRQYLESLSEMDSATTQEVDTDKIAAIKDRISQGYYNDPEVIEATADKILEILG